VARARELIDRKDPQAAWALLAPLAAARAGEADFDYWLGVAALETDRLEQAAFALERVLDRQPEFDSARLELARVYLRMGSLDLAEQEFDRLVPRAKNDEGRRVLEGYLAEVARLKARQRFSVSGYLEAGAGHDGNLSSAARDFGGAVESSFGLPGIQPTGNSVQRSAPFAATAGGVSATWKLADDRTAFASAEARWRGYRDQRDFDYALVDLSAGHQWRRGEHTITAVAFGQAFRQDGAFDETVSSSRLANDRDAWGVFAEVRRDLTAELQAAFGAQWGAFRYDTNPTQDTDQWQLFGSLVHRPGWWKGGTLGLSAQVSRDDAKRPLNAFGPTTISRHGGGLRLMAASNPAARLSWSAYAGYTLRIDDDPYARATLVPTGRDELGEASLRLSWRLADKWVVQPSVTWVRNLSNIAIYTFTKIEGGIVVRRDFP
jgi:tetratricopeptide (TPR) repeat protein